MIELSRLTGLRRPLEVRDFRLLWLAQLTSELGDWAARLALSVLVLDRSGSAFLAGLVTAASLLPWIGLGQVLAVLGDRLPRRTIMIASDLVRAALFLIMLAPIGVAALLALVFVAGAASPAFTSAKSAMLPTILPDERCGDGIAVNQLTGQMSLLLGFLSGGGLVTVAGAEGALAVNAGSFLVSALLIVPLHGGRVARTTRSIGGQLRGQRRPRPVRPTLIRQMFNPMWSSAWFRPLSLSRMPTGR